MGKVYNCMSEYVFRVQWLDITEDLRTCSQPEGK